MAKLLKNQKGFHHIVLLLIIVIVAVVGLVGYRVFKASGPGCPKSLSGVFTKSFVDPEKILALRPLGSTDGMGHILPMDHTEFTFKAAVDEKIPVYAPTQITITKIAKHTDYSADGTPLTTQSNYMFDFTICRGVTGWSEFIHELSPDIQSVWDKAKKTHDEGPLNQGAKAVNDTARAGITLKAGLLLGYTNTEPSLALSIYDTRSKPNDVNASYYGNNQRIVNAVCFTDLYAGDLKNTLNAKYGYYEDRQGSTPGFTPRTIEPRCGQVIQNITGTVQGDWFANRAKKDENLESEGKTISFIHNNYDPSLAEISIGGNIVPNPQTFAFKPSHAGIVGREFSETQAGETYCYKNAPARPGFIFVPANNDSRVLVKLLDEHHLKIEVQTGDCENSPEFMKAIIYER
jgi:hypothetical protein